MWTYLPNKPKEGKKVGEWLFKFETQKKYAISVQECGFPANYEYSDKIPPTFSDFLRWLESEHGLLADLLSKAKTYRVEMPVAIEVLSQWKARGRPHQEAPQKRWKNSVPDCTAQWIQGYKLEHS